MSDRPGPIQRRSSSRLSRRSSTEPYSRPSSGSTGLTKYIGDVNLDFKTESAAQPEDAAMDEVEDTVPEISESSRTRTFARAAMSFVPGKRGRKVTARAEDEGIVEEEDSFEEIEKRSVSTFGRALSSFKTGKPTAPKEIDIWKPDIDAVLGLTFEVPEDDTLKGVVVASIQSAGLIARSKKLKVGDVLHSVNGRCGRM